MILSLEHLKKTQWCVECHQHSIVFNEYTMVLHVIFYKEVNTVLYSHINLNATRKTQLIPPLQVITYDSITRAAVDRTAVRSELKSQVCLSKIVISII